MAGGEEQERARYHHVCPPAYLYVITGKTFILAQQQSASCTWPSCMPYMALLLPALFEPEPAKCVVVTAAATTTSSHAPGKIGLQQPVPSTVHVPGSQHTLAPPDSGHGILGAGQVSCGGMQVCFAISYIKPTSQHLLLSLSHRSSGQQTLDTVPSEFAKSVHVVAQHRASPEGVLVVLSRYLHTLSCTHIHMWWCQKQTVGSRQHVANSRALHTSAQHDLARELNGATVRG